MKFCSNVVPSLIPITANFFSTSFKFVQAIQNLLSVPWYFLMFKFYSNNTKSNYINIIHINSLQVSFKLSHFIFKMSATGWDTSLKALAKVLNSLVNWFLRQFRPNLQQCILQLCNCFWFGLKFVVLFQHSTPNMVVERIEIGRIGGPLFLDTFLSLFFEWDSILYYWSKTWTLKNIMVLTINSVLLVQI